MKHIFILKPTTNSELVNKIVTLMQGRQYELVYTRDIEHVKEIARSYNDSEEKCRLYAVGGDGFVHKVANGMVNSQNELVVIPQGTGNDFARGIYKTLDPIDILKESLKLDAHPIDLIQCGEDLYCINVMCCALDAQVGNMVNKNRDSKVPKPLQYVYHVMDCVLHFRFYPTEIKTDDETLYKGDAVVCAFCNNKYFGGGYLVSPTCAIDDGLIDISVVGDIKKKQLPYYVSKLQTARLHKTPAFKHYQCDHVTVHSTQIVNIDGEPQRPGVFELSIVKDAIQLVYDKK